MYDDGFELRQLYCGGSPIYRQTHFRNDGYILRDMLSSGVVVVYQYSDTMKLTEKTTRNSLTSFDRWTNEYDNLDRRISTIQSQSADSLNWTPIQKWKYFYNGETQSAGYNFEKYENYLVFLEEVPFVPNSYKRSHYTIWGYEAGEWVLQQTITIYSDGQYYEAQNQSANFYSNGLYKGYFTPGAGTESAHEITWFAGSTDLQDDLMPQANTELHGYPNPFVSKLTLELSKSGTEPLLLQIFNMKGQLLKQDNFSPGQEVSWDGMNASGKTVPKGVYLIRVIEGSKSYETKVVKL